MSVLKQRTYGASRVMLLDELDNVLLWVSAQNTKQMILVPQAFHSLKKKQKKKTFLPSHLFALMYSYFERSI